MTPLSWLANPIIQNKSYWPIILIAFLNTFILQAGLYINIPSLPQMTSVFHTDETNMQLTYSYFILGMGIYLFSYGYISTKINIRILFIMGNVFVLISSCLILLTRNVHYLFLLRMLQGIGSGSGSLSIITGILRGNYESKKFTTVISYVITIGTLITITTPLLGGWLQLLFDWTASFIFLSLFALLVATLSFLFLPGIHSKAKEGSYIEVIKKHFSNKNYMLNVLYTILIAAMITSFNLVTPFLLQKRLALSPMITGVIVALITGLFSVGSSVNSVLVAHFGYKKMIKLGLLISSLAILCLVVTSYRLQDSALAVIIPFGMMGFGLALVYPNVISRSFADARLHLATSSSIFGSLQFVMIFIAFTLVAILPENTPVPYAWFIASFQLTMLLLMALFHKQYFYFKKK